MNLLQQAIQLLSQSPGSVIYHLVTLFALQAVLALSFSQWRRDRTDKRAARMAWAAGLIFLARVGLMFFSLAVSDDPETAVSALPPLEQLIHTVTAVLLVWSLAPLTPQHPRLGDALLLISLVVIGVMYAFFSQEWQSQALLGNPYNSARQATIWGIVQIGVLTIGGVLILTSQRLQFSLHPLVIGLLLLAHIAHFWNYPEIIPTETEISYWIRLGHLVVFPLWAVLAYRHSLAQLLAAQATSTPPVNQLAQTLHLSTEVIGSWQLKQTLLRAIDMVANMVGSPFIGVALADEDNVQQLHLTSNQPQVDRDEPRSWYLNLADWPAFRLAVEQKQLVELIPDGLGARQLHDWYKEMGVAPLGALLIQPLLVKDSPIGLLLLSAPEGRNEWPEQPQALIPALADYIAQAIDNTRVQTRIRHEVSAPPTPAESPAPVSGRIIALEEETERLLAELETANSRLQQSEARATEADKRARDLAATLEEMERTSRDDQIETLETEVASLRESLIEAEEAMAMASAGEGGLSPEWVMMTITRYSGQLEEAQARIEALEAELARRGEGPSSKVVASLAQELRTPMTSIAGYTDLLLGETLGILGAKQRDFLQRVKANTDRMGALLEQIIQMTAVSEQPVRPDEELVDVREVIETAINNTISQIRKKNLRLDLNIAHDLPPLTIKRGDLHQIMTNLLNNACQSSASNGRVAISAHTDAVPETNPNGHSETFGFMHLAITDSGGGISTDHHGRIFDPQHRADDPLIPGLGETGAGLAMTRSLVQANGGRIWVESEIGTGSTFSILFPIPTVMDITQTSDGADEGTG